MNPTSAVLAVLGGIVAMAGFVVKQLPLVHGHTLPEANGLCASTLGYLAQGYSAAVATKCSEVHTWNMVSGWAVLLGAVAVIAGAAVYLIQAASKAGILS